MKSTMSKKTAHLVMTMSYVTTTMVTILRLSWSRTALKNWEMTVMGKGMGMEMTVMGG